MSHGFPSAEMVFKTAAEQFVDQLSDEDKANFQRIDNPSDMVASIEQHISSLNSPRTARLLDACKKIDAFGKIMSPFFGIVNILVSSHPDWAAIVWGAIRLVFQCSSHFVGFFEKLADMFVEIRRKLPSYFNHLRVIRDRIADRKLKAAWQETHGCLLRALSLVYIDILQFCHDAYRLFAKKRRGVRYKVAVIWDLFWTPFDDRFAEILVRLKRHQEDFDSSLAVAYSEEMITHFNDMDQERHKNAEQRERFVKQHEAAERAAIDVKLQSLYHWIGASKWTGPFELAKFKRAENTGYWILDQPEYKDWLAQPVPYPNPGSIFAKNVLVISAKPGYGKTVLSTRIVEDLQHRVRKDRESDTVSGLSSTACLAYYYFDQQQADRFSNVTALKAICTQLLHAQRRNKTFIDIACLIRRAEDDGQIFASEQALESLLMIYLQQFRNAYIVFDALDECSEWAEFLVSLRKCAEHTSTKIVILMRPAVW